MSHFYKFPIINIWNTKTIIPPTLKEENRKNYTVNINNTVNNDHIQFAVSCQCKITLKSLDIKYNNNPVQKENILVIGSHDANSIIFNFFSTNLKDYHIFDVFEILIAFEEVSCQFTFEFRSKYNDGRWNNPKLLDFDSIDDFSTVRKLFKNNFKLMGSSDEKEKTLLQKFSNYNKMSMQDKILSQQLYEMLAFGLLVENLEECERFVPYILSEVSIEKKMIDTNNYQYIFYYYNRRSFKEVQDKPGDFRLEIMTMEEHEQKKISPHLMISFNCYGVSGIVFNLKENLDEKSRYHIKIFLTSTITFRKCLNALRLLKSSGMQEFYNCLEYPGETKNLTVKINGTTYQDQINPHLSAIEKLYMPHIEVQNQFEYFNKTVNSNAEQMLAVQNILRKEAFPYPFVVFGPPGTGKTTVIVESIAQIIKRDQNARILVTSQSNSACDEIGVRLLKYIPRGKIYRHYSRSCEDRRDKIPVELLKISNMRTETFRDSITVDEFYHFNINILTLVSSTKFIELLPRKNFDYIFIDEAGASTEPEILVPITAYGMKSNLILFGDHKQLGPVVQSEFAETLGLGVSLLERIMETKHYKKDDSVLKVQLLDNYRSHPKLLEIPNKLFYDSKLRSKISKEEVEFAVGWKLLPNKEIPIILNSVNGFCSKEGESSLNNKEIEVVKFYVDSLLKFGINGKEVTEKDIGIVTPYRAQLKWLKRTFYNKRDIEIGTTELYQGREKKIIIITTVKSGNFSVGFLANEKRLNVMLTRAKCLMIVVCNPKVLQKDPNWRSFIEFCVENRVCHGNKIKLERTENIEAKAKFDVKNTSSSSSILTDHIEKRFDLEIAESTNVLKRKAEEIEGKTDEEINREKVKRIKTSELLKENDLLKSNELANYSHHNGNTNQANNNIENAAKAHSSHSSLSSSFKREFFNENAMIRTPISYNEASMNPLFSWNFGVSTKVSLEKGDKGHRAIIQNSDSTSVVRSQLKTTAVSNMERSSDLGISKIPVLNASEHQNSELTSILRRPRKSLQNTECVRVTRSKSKIAAVSNKVPVLSERCNESNNNVEESAAETQNKRESEQIQTEKSSNFIAVLKQRLVRTRSSNRTYSKSDSSAKVSQEKCEIDGIGNSEGHQESIQNFDSTSVIRSQPITAVVSKLERSFDSKSSNVSVLNENGQQESLQNSKSVRVTRSKSKIAAVSNKVQVPRKINNEWNINVAAKPKKIQQRKQKQALPSDTSENNEKQNSGEHKDAIQMFDSVRMTRSKLKLAASSGKTCDLKVPGLTVDSSESKVSRKYLTRKRQSLLQ